VRLQDIVTSSHPIVNQESLEDQKGARVPWGWHAREVQEYRSFKKHRKRGTERHEGVEKEGALLEEGAIGL